MRRLFRLMMAIATVGFMAAPAAPALAYGDGAAHEMWQIGYSGNCTDPLVCEQLDTGTGGFWGWAEFDRSPDGTQTWGDAEFAECYHVVGAGGPGSAGSFHSRIEITSWTIEPGSAGPHTFYATGEETDFGAGGVVFTSPFDHMDTGIPADPGHYTSEDLFGVSGPGIAVQVQVAYRAAK